MDGDGAGAPTDEPAVATALVEEFGDRIPRRVIERIAREELGLFSRTKDRSRVPAVAWRLARGRLQEMLPTPAPGDAQIAS
jgi:hypothetical protein